MKINNRIQIDKEEERKSLIFIDFEMKNNSTLIKSRKEQKKMNKIKNEKMMFEKISKSTTFFQPIRFYPIKDFAKKPKTLRFFFLFFVVLFVDLTSIHIHVQT
jgi:hypothetical protein